MTSKQLAVLLADEWWRAEGVQHVNPDVEEVEFYDKQKEFAEIAFTAGYNAALGGRV